MKLQNILKYNIYTYKLKKICMDCDIKVYKLKKWMNNGYWISTEKFNIIVQKVRV
jgi:hypothetical protein